MHLAAAENGRHLRRLAALALVAAGATGLAAQLARVEKSTLRVVADRTAYEAGEGARLAAVMTIEAGWHTNSHRPTYDYLIPTDLEVELPEGWGEATVDYPAGEIKAFAFADDPLSVYEGEVKIFARLTLPGAAAAGEHTLTAALTYQACDDRSCLPPVTTRQPVVLTVGPGGTPTEDPAFAAGGTPGADEAGGTGEGGTGLAWILFLGVVGGLILNAMPCVLPVLSLKVFGLVKAAGHGRAQVVSGALATAAGILLSFWALALAAIIARAAGEAAGWGVQFQDPRFVAALAVVMVLFSLNLWGLFEVPLPARIAQAAGGGPREGIAGHLFAGLFATLMATPCSAPFLGPAVGFALSQEPFAVAAVFTAIGVGMALPYFVLAAFPASARWLPKPGPWMARFKVVMGFLLAGAAVWLLYVLSSQVTPERLAFLELALVGLALFVWVHKQTAAGSWARRAALAGVVAAIVATLGLATRSDAGGSGLLTWLEFDRPEAERLAGSGRLVFVDVTADWCFTCKVNERLVLETPEVAAAFESHGVIAMKADWTNRNDEIARFLSDHGRYGIPFYLLYRPGAEPHLFGELLTKDGLIRTVEASAEGTGDRVANR